MIWDTSYTPSLPAISDCDELEQNNDGHNPLQTNLKAVTTGMRYFARSKFFGSLVRKEKSGLI